MEASYGITALSPNGYPIEVMNEISAKIALPHLQCDIEQPCSDLFWSQMLQRMFRTQNENQQEIQHHASMEASYGITALSRYGYQGKFPQRLRASTNMCP